MCDDLCGDLLPVICGAICLVFTVCIGIVIYFTFDIPPVLCSSFNVDRFLVVATLGIYCCYCYCIYLVLQLFGIPTTTLFVLVDICYLLTYLKFPIIVLSPGGTHFIPDLILFFDIPIYLQTPPTFVEFYIDLFTDILLVVAPPTFGRRLFCPGAAAALPGRTCCAGVPFV